MSVINTPIIAYLVNYQCDVCAADNVIKDETIPFNYILPIIYVCPKCKAQVKLEADYPFTEYK